jgi:hypothetical protein
MKNIVIISLLIGAGISACSDNHSVAYYKAHEAEAREVRTRCAANGMAGTDCGNASVALKELGREAFERDRERERQNIEKNVRPVLH